MIVSKGNKYGRLTAVERYDRLSGGKIRTFWECKCDCGNKTVVRSDHLQSGASQSCGCLQKEAASTANRKITPFTIIGDVAIGKTTQGVEFFVDAEDVNKLNDKTWTLSANGYLQTNLYREGRTVLLHKFIVGDYEKGFCVDHIDRNKLNNRKSNLRICRQADNAKNSSLRSDNTSGVTGVYKDKRNGGWRVEITANKERHYLGTFSNYYDAVKTRREAERLYFGEYAPRHYGKGGAK